VGCWAACRCSSGCSAMALSIVAMLPSQLAPHGVNHSQDCQAVPGHGLGRPPLLRTVRAWACIVVRVMSSVGLGEAPRGHGLQVRQRLEGKVNELLEEAAGLKQWTIDQARARSVHGWPAPNCWRMHGRSPGPQPGCMLHVREEVPTIGMWLFKVRLQTELVCTANRLHVRSVLSRRRAKSCFTRRQPPTL